MVVGMHNKLAETLSNDPQASGGVVVDDQDNLSVLSGFMSELFRNSSGRWYVQCEQSLNATVFLYGGRWV